MNNPNSLLNIQVRELLICRESRMDVNEILKSEKKLKFAKDYPVLFRMLTSYDRELDKDTLFKMLNMMDDINKKKITAEAGTQIIVTDLQQSFTSHIDSSLRVEETKANDTTL